MKSVVLLINYVHRIGNSLTWPNIIEFLAIDIYSQIIIYTSLTRVLMIQQEQSTQTTNLHIVYLLTLIPKDFK